MPTATVTRLTAVGPPRAGSASAVLRPFAGGGATSGTRAEWWTGSRLAATRRPVVADAAAVSVYGLTPRARDQLQRTGAIAAEGTAGPALVAELGGHLPDGAVIVPADEAPGLDTVLIAPGLINRLQFLTEPGPVVLRNPAPLDPGLRARLRALGWPFPAGGEADEADHAIVDFTESPDLRPMVLAEVGLAAGSVLVTLGVIAAGLSLAGAETRRERELLMVSGAAPRTIAGINGRKAALVVVIGTLLALPVGLLPAWASLDAAGRQQAFAVPWRTVGLLVVAVPVMAGIGAGAASALALRRRPVAISTMAVD
jgi:hypothetical protein